MIEHGRTLLSMAGSRGSASQRSKGRALGPAFFAYHCAIKPTLVPESPRTCQAEETEAEKKHRGGFGNIITYSNIVYLERELRAGELEFVEIRQSDEIYIMV